MLVILSVMLCSLAGANALWPHSVSAAASPVRITELMYDPTGTGDREFIEIYNGSDIAANLGGMSMVGVTFTFPAGTTLGAGQYAVIVRNLTAFRAINGLARVLGQYTGKLQGSGESVQIVSGGIAISRVDYLFGGAWPSTPKNGGPSLSLIRSNADESIAACWAPSAGTGGTPGLANTVDASWSSSHAGGCTNKLYPSTVAVAPPSASTATPAQQQTAAAQAAQTAEQAKKQEQQKQKLEAQAKAEAAVMQKAKADAVQARTKAAHQSRLYLVLAAVGLMLALAAFGSFLLFRKLRHKRQFSQLLKDTKISHHEAKNKSH